MEQKIGIEKTDRVPVWFAEYYLTSAKNHWTDLMNHIQSELLSVLHDNYLNVCLISTYSNTAAGVSPDNYFVGCI